MCMSVFELQLAGGIGQYPLNRNQTVYYAIPTKDLLGRIIQQICVGLFVDVRA